MVPLIHWDLHLLMGNLKNHAMLLYHEDKKFSIKTIWIIICVGHEDVWYIDEHLFLSMCKCIASNVVKIQI